MNIETIKAGAVLLFDKPIKWTSFDVVNYSRKVLGGIKVGHAGTLDPLATGLLVMCTGAFTKKISELTLLDKEYTGIITIGSTTPSFDLETEVNENFPIEYITEDLIKEAAKKFLGTTMQTPPIYSAKKIDGERAYYKARRGEQVEMKVIEITLTDFEITNCEFNTATIDVHFRVVCTKGTYIRSLAYDFGKALNSGAHLSALRRTRIGEYKVEDALTLDQFREKYSVLKRKEKVD